MSDFDPKEMSVLDIFASQEETFDEAKQKISEESRQSIQYLRFSKDGRYPIRICPIAPVVGADGNVVTDRKGYEYPLRSLTLKIDTTGGKKKQVYATVCNVKQAFPDLSEDLIDAYVRVAREKYAKDGKFVELLGKSSFYGGLKWDYHRCAYVFDDENRNDGLKIYQFTYSVYRDLEDLKISVWEKLRKNDHKRTCPISSVKGAYKVEIARRTENDKTGYSSSIDLASGIDDLSEKEMQQLFDAPRLPEVIYRYTRWHLEATIAFLNQFDEKHSVNVMGEQEIADCISAIKMMIPSSDTSHFTLNGKSDETDDAEQKSNGLDSLWERFDTLQEQGLDDKSDEGAELRADIRDFVEDNELDIKNFRSKTNGEILNEIDAIMNNHDDGVGSQADDHEDGADVQNGSDDDPHQEEDSSMRRERNDDTNEPAARTSRGERIHRRR